MFCKICSAALSGVDAVPVDVEADVSDGMPMFNIVGYVSSQVREAQERVRTALRNQNLALPPKRITINLAPGDLRKDGTRFDLPIAAAILIATGQISDQFLKDALIIGELHLDGTIGKVNGVLPSVMMARENGCSCCIVPEENLEEGKIVSGIPVTAICHLADLITFSKDGKIEHSKTDECTLAKKESSNIYEVEMTPRNQKNRTSEKDGGQKSGKRQPDFADIHGQIPAKRAALIAAAGFHNLLLSGPPGSGKSMTAERIPSILPPLTAEESLELSKIYSVCGLLPAEHPIITTRPFRSPHHTISSSALCGGGRYPTPGEVTLSHRGVLFLDEFPEMASSTLEMLRQPLENHTIQIARLDNTQQFPAAFLLVAAMNPCPCGYYPNRNRCTCTVPEIRAYQAKISQAMLDRIDLRCVVSAASYEDLTGADFDGNGRTKKQQKELAEWSSAPMRKKVVQACERQKLRYENEGIIFNSELSSAVIMKYCDMTEEGSRMLRSAFRTMGLSARGYHHVLKVARTIADLEEEDWISEAHISEALCFRTESA